MNCNSCSRFIEKLLADCIQQLRPTQRQTKRTRGTASSCPATPERRSFEFLRGHQSSPGNEAGSRVDSQPCKVSVDCPPLLPFPSLHPRDSAVSNDRRHWTPLRPAMEFRRAPLTMVFLASPVRFAQVCGTKSCSFDLKCSFADCACLQCAENQGGGRTPRRIPTRIE